MLHPTYQRFIARDSMRFVSDGNSRADADNTSDDAWRLGHQGLMHDSETGLLYNRARYLHPTLGRFTARDSQGYVDGLSLYQYGLSNPINELDPQGTSTVKVGEIQWRPPATVDPNHPHVPRQGTAGVGVPIGQDLGRHSHSADGRFKWFPDHNVILDTKTGKYQKAPSTWPKEFEKQLQNKKANVRAKWALGLLLIISLANTSQTDADNIRDMVNDIERDIRNGKWGSPSTEGLVAGLADALAQMFGIDSTVAYKIVSDHFQGITGSEGEDE